MTQNALRRRWKEGKAAVNGWLAIPSAFSAEVMAQCGWDSITVDLQHGVQDYLSMVACFQAMHAHPVTRLVRVPWNEPLLYVERWLTAPMEHDDGMKAERTRGTPQGGVVSPILANLFLHYTFDLWMTRLHPDLPWCRYADDGLVHCRNEQEALALKTELQARLAECRLEMHQTKTRIAYCKDGNRKGKYPNIQFDFLGYGFRPRLVRRARDNTLFWGFNPAVSASALKAMRAAIRELNLRHRTDLPMDEIARQINPLLRGWIEYYGRYSPSALSFAQIRTLDDLARMFNNHIRGWINYYGRFYKSALYPALRHIDRILARWVHRKFKSLRRHKRRTHHWLAHVVRRQPDLFAHWSLLHGRGRTMGAG